VTVGRGLLAAELTSAIASQLGLTEQGGVVVSRVERGSPAAQSGLARGDVIRSVDRVAVSSPGQLKTLLANRARHVLALEREGQLYLAALEP
jgi:S1-C subfamily serine protease